MKAESAAENFVQMIEEMQVLSATDFLISLYALESNNWKYESERVGSDATGGILVRKDSDGNYDPLHGQFSMIAALYNAGRDDPRKNYKSKFLPNITTPFLLRRSGA